MRWFSGRGGPAISVGLLFLFGAACFPLVAQMKSAAVGVVLRAVLVQSLRMSATPEPGLMSYFISSGEAVDSPVTFSASWVRGPGTVSIAVFSSKFGEDFRSSQPLMTMTPGANSVAASGLPGMEIASGNLRLQKIEKEEESDRAHTQSLDFARDDRADEAEGASPTDQDDVLTIRAQVI